ncbi:hypothetical protein M426DRAFT_319749 [Hypoxylon sp. CI-4A]|nr:hypothetical protein M426DRAFT_319749 [Hypoxylon sp. CI-4A]
MTLPFPHPSGLLPPGFTMSRCTPVDVPGMTSVFIKAFSSAPAFTCWWSPDLAVMQAWHSKRIRLRFSDPKTQQFKVVDDATSAIVAFAKWDPPAHLRGLKEGFVVYDDEGNVVERREREEGEGGGDGDGPQAGGRSQILKPPEGGNAELYKEFFTGLRDTAVKWNAGEKLVLSILCTDPAYHGRGVGSAMIQSVLDVADAEGVTSYLESLPLPAPLYKRHGFVPVDTLEYDLTRAGLEDKAVLTIMEREPKAKGA